MKFFATAALVGLAAAQDALIDCSEADPNCEALAGEGFVCIQRTIDAIGSTKDTDYKNLVKTDSLMGKGDVSTKCTDAETAATNLADSGSKNSKTTVTATYVLLEYTPPAEEPAGEEAGDSAMNLAASALVAGSVAAMTLF